jgi:hypothetical protein
MHGSDSEVEFAPRRRGKRKEENPMKINHIVILSLAVGFGFPQLAGAKLSMTPQALGFVEATLNYCGKVDPASAEKYKAREKAFVGDATEDELDKARTTGEYKDSYGSRTSDLEKVPKEQTVKTCTAFLDGK